MRIKMKRHLKSQNYCYKNKTSRSEGLKKVLINHKRKSQLVIHLSKNKKVKVRSSNNKRSKSQTHLKNHLPTKRYPILKLKYRT